MCQLNGFNVMHVLDAGIKLKVYISQADSNLTSLAQSSETFPIPIPGYQFKRKMENSGANWQSDEKSNKRAE